MKQACTFFFILLCELLTSQDVCNLVVYDVINHRPVDKAVVMALSPQSQMMYRYSRTNGLGKAQFEFREKVDSFKLWVLHPKFVNYKSKAIQCTGGKVKDTVYVYPASRVLRTVFIKEKRAVTIKGDTYSLCS